MIQLRQTEISFFDFYKRLEHHGLAWDWWLESPKLAETQHTKRVVFEIVREGQRIGLAWAHPSLDDAAGRRVTIGICVDRVHRRSWVPGDVAELMGFIDFCFSKWRVDRLAVVMPGDRYVAERFFKDLGFKFEARILDGTRVRGRLRHVVSLGLTRAYYNRMRGGALDARSYDPAGAGEPGRQGGRNSWRALWRRRAAVDPA